MIFDDLGRVPFVEEPQKLAYMWRDIERRAIRNGLSPSLPAPWPAPQVLQAIRLSYVALQEDWGREYIQHFYREWIERAPRGRGTECFR